MDWLKNLLNLTPEQAEVLDELPQSVEGVKAEMQANIDAVVAENDGLKAELETLKAEVADRAEKYENAEKVVAEFSAKMAETEAVNVELQEKLDKLTAGVKPIEQTEPVTDTKQLVNLIHAKVEETGKSYEDCAVIVMGENPELYNKLVNSKRK